MVHGSSCDHAPVAAVVGLELISHRPMDIGCVLRVESRRIFVVRCVSLQATHHLRHATCEPGASGSCSRDSGVRTSAPDFVQLYN